MPVTELAQLRLLPGALLTSSSLRQTLRQARDAMTSSAKFPFELLHCIEDPNLIFVIGTWPSIDFHMHQFIPGAANQELLKLLDGRVAVDWMFHTEIDGTQTTLPLTRDVVAMTRCFVHADARDGFQTTFTASKPILNSYIGDAAHVVGGWRLDQGYSPSPEQEFGDEFVLLTAWDSVEQHEGFAQTPNFSEYARVREHVTRFEIKHASKLDLDS